MLPPMTRHLFRRLRRCRALFALALCAWLALGSVVWAQADGCCPEMASSMGMGMHHDAVAPDHGATHAALMTPDSCCAHATVSVPPSMSGHMLHAQPGHMSWQ